MFTIPWTVNHPTEIQAMSIIQQKIAVKDPLCTTRKWYADIEVRIIRVIVARFIEETQ